MPLPLLGIFDFLGKIVSDVIPDPNKKMEYNIELAKLADQAAQREHDELMGQVEVNKVEASNVNMFVAGWRPAVGWICAAGVAYSFILFPFISFLAVIEGFKGALPVVSTSDLMVLLTGMLGFGGLRSYEKVQGVASGVVAAVSKVLPEKAPWDKK